MNKKSIGIGFITLLLYFSTAGASNHGILECPFVGCSGGIDSFGDYADIKSQEEMLNDFEDHREQLQMEMQREMDLDQQRWDVERYGDDYGY